MVGVLPMRYRRSSGGCAEGQELIQDSGTFCATNCKRGQTRATRTPLLCVSYLVDRRLKPTHPEHQCQLCHLAQGRMPLSVSYTA